jgi:hypothetical protein
MEITSSHENTTNNGVDWTAMVRLAAITSVIAAMVAALAYGLLPNTTIIVTIIVVATMASWYRLDHPHRGAHANSQRHLHRH